MWAIYIFNLFFLLQKKKVKYFKVEMQSIYVTVMTFAFLRSIEKTIVRLSVDPACCGPL